MESICNSDTIRKELRQVWFKLCRDIQLEPETTEKWFSVVEAKYNESQRYYHTLRHLQSMMDHFTQWKDKLSKPNDIMIAIYFHDIVYDPVRNDNEEKSIDLFTEFCKESADQISKEMMENVVYFIRSTITHTVNNKHDNTDLEYFLDFDMAILGVSTQEFEEYSKNIRREYCHFEDRIYAEKRIKVLESFLKRPSIYFTETFKQLYEKKARENITNEIILLK